MAFITRNDASNGSLDLMLFDRSSGKPITSAQVNVFQQEYNPSSKLVNWNFLKIEKPNGEGLITFKKNVINETYRFYVVSGKDTLTTSSNYYIHQNNATTRTITKTHFFTDRAIYRPGQTVYFKGLIVESENDSKALKTNFSTTVKLFNPNGEELNQLNVSTNDYGSYQGSFILPNSGLNGQYRIQDGSGMQYFSVEEYKRPTFKIALDERKEQVKLNEQLAINGKVLAYSGEGIADASITYQVKRTVYYPYFRYWRMPPISNESVIIANGNLKAAADGSFSFEFTAFAPELGNQIYQPSYNYELVIDATSLSGETQSINESIQLSHQALFLDAKIEPAIQLEDLKQLQINAKTINGKPVTAKAKLNLYQLQTPEKISVPKLWQETSQQVIEKKSYQKNFPEYDYKANREINDFERGVLISSSMIDCNQVLDLFKEIKSGAYEIEVLANDLYGNPVKWNERFVLYDSKSKQLPYPIFSWFQALKVQGEPGETAEFLIGTSLKNLRLLYEIEHNKKIVSKQWLTLKNEQRLIQIPIEEKHRGNFTIHFTAVHSNRLIQHSETIKVPYSNKKLNVKLTTFRKLVEPASQEKWDIEIESPDGNSEAELLLGMYDESLDQFTSIDWGLNLYLPKGASFSWNAYQQFSLRSSQWVNYHRQSFLPIPQRTYPNLNWFGLNLGYYYGNYRTMSLSKPEGEEMMLSDIASESAVIARDDISAMKSRAKVEAPAKTKSIDNPVRSDFRETAFFYPQMKVNKNGKLRFEFKMPDVLTSWKFRAMAHSKDLKIGFSEEVIQTQKKLMVKPNYPRFFRAGDTVILKVLIHNLGFDAVSGHARIEAFDAQTGLKLALFTANSSDLPFDLVKNQSKVVDWSLFIPEDLKAIKLKFSASSKTHSDAEEKLIPVLSNRALITESLPLFVRGNQSKSFTFDKLIESANSKKLVHQAFTFEFSPNPAWYAVQALPYINEREDENSEQLFARLYANSIAKLIANSQPEIKRIFDQWKDFEPEALTSKLMQNQELKSILLEETPWLQAAKDETEQKRRLALLFDFNRMANEQAEVIQKLSDLQLPNGAWPWFKGMYENRYITQYLLEGFGKLRRMGIEFKDSKAVNLMIERGLAYLDNSVKKDYERLLSDKVNLDQHTVSHQHIHYLYTRSYFDDFQEAVKGEAQAYFLKQVEKQWTNQTNYLKGMLALSIYRLKEKTETSQIILNSIKEFAIGDEKTGMYWKITGRSPYWYQAPIETQALMIEAFNEIAKDSKTVEELKVWLLKEKQTSSWKSSKATAMACYALLINGQNLLQASSNLSLTIGDQRFLAKEQVRESGTNYFKKTWLKESVKPNFGNITINNPDSGIAWGAAYWQYKTDLNEVSGAETNELKIKREYFLYQVNDGKEQLIPITTNGLTIGDRVKVRIRIESARALEFVSLKDMRPAAFEPLDVISSRKMQDGLIYYQSTKDASTNFFFDWLPKGVYVFEYDLKVNQAGVFSSGFSKLEGYYAPEFSSHSEGISIKIRNQ